MNKTEIKIVQCSDRELHMVGEFVAVAWNLKTVTKSVTQDGIEYTAKTKERKGKPYIDFVWLREDSNGGFYEDEDSPVDGGFDPSSATSLIQELQAAIDYINNLTES